MRRLMVGTPPPTVMPTAKSPTMSMKAAMGPPWNCPVPIRRSSSGRIGMVTVSVPAS